jgi:hypothetical protein
VSANEVAVLPLTPILVQASFLAPTSFQVTTPVYFAAPATEPLECCELGSKGPDIQPALQCNIFEVLVRDVQIHGIAQQGDLVRGPLSEFLQRLDEPVLLDVIDGPRRADLNKDARALMFRALLNHGLKKPLCFFDRFAVGQYRPEKGGFDRDLVVHMSVSGGCRRRILASPNHYNL